MHGRRAGKVMVTALLAVAAAACGSSQAGSSGGGGSNPKTILIGNVEDLSGPAAVYGVPESNGAVLAADEVNAAGGISCLGGAKLQIKKFDTASDPNNGPTQAQAAVAANVAAVVGGEISDTVLAGTNVTQRAGIPWMDTGGTANKIHERGYDTVFQNVYDSTQFATGWYNTMKLAAKQLNVSQPTVAIAYSQTSYGQEFLSAWNQVNASGFFKVVTEFGYPLSTTDFSPIAARLAAAPANFILNMGYPNDGLQLTKLFGTKFTTHAQVWVAAGSAPSDVISQVGAASNGTILGGTLEPSWKSATPAFKKEYQAYGAKFGTQNITEQAWFGYTSVKFLAAALDKACSTNGHKIATALHQVKLTQSNGNVFPYPKVLQFTANGTLAEVPFFSGQIVDQKLVPVYPSIVAESSIVPYHG